MAYTIPDAEVSSAYAKLAISGINILNITVVPDKANHFCAIVEYYWDDPDVRGKIRWSKAPFYFTSTLNWADDLIQYIESTRAQLKGFYGRKH